MRAHRQQLMDALQQARRDRAAAATVIEEIGEPGLAVNGGAWSGVIPATSVPMFQTHAGAAQSLGEITASGGGAASASVSRKRKPVSDANESGAEHVNKRLFRAAQTSGDAMDVA